MRIKSKMILSLEASKITQDASRRLVSDTQIASWDSKFDAVPATSTQEGLMTIALYKKLASIDDDANNYVHPSSHPASMITEDALHRFVSDVEKANWNAKASTDIAVKSSGGVGGSDGLMSAEMAEKLESIDEGANNYIHPATHPASMITEDSTHRFVTDTEKSTWNSKQDALGFTPVNTATIGQADGVASLDSNGKVPVSQMPDTAMGKTIIVSDNSSADSLDFSKWNTGDRLIILDTGAPTNSREGYIYEDNNGDDVGSFVSGTYGNNTDKFYKDSDTDWANVNIDWANLVNKPTSSVMDIDAVANMKTQLEADTAKLKTIAENAEVNQNAVQIIKVNGTNVVAESKNSTVEFIQGSNISITGSNDNKTVTLAVAGKVPEATHSDKATLADKLTSTRIIELTGDVTGQVSFDGSSNVQIVTTVVELNTHSHEISDVSGLQAALDSKATKAVATNSSDGLMSASDKIKLEASKNRFSKDVTIIGVSGGAGTEISTGIKTDGTGQNYTDITDIVSLSVNGLIQTKGTDKDYTVAEKVGNELVVTWKGRHFNLDADDEIVIVFNQLG